MGFEQAGFRNLWRGELAKDPSDVLAKLPGGPNLGDVTKIDGNAIDVPDVVVWGSPCQDMSPANRKRDGLKGDHSGLFYAGCDVLRGLVHRGLRFSVWENVGGALYSNGGEDFRQVLLEFLELGAVDVCWRVFDARFFGVPQSRRRVFVVCDFGGRSAGTVLRYATSSGLLPETGEGDGLELPAGDCGGVVTARDPARPGRKFGSDFVNAMTCTKPSSRMDARLGGGDFVGTLRTRDPARSERRYGSDFVAGAVRRTKPREDGVAILPITSHPDKQMRERGSGLIAATMPSLKTGVTKGMKERIESMIPDSMRLRWRTPLESERLMGWPDNWTEYGASGKKMSDAQRYAMCGNGVVAPVAKYLAEGVAFALGENTRLLKETTPVTTETADLNLWGRGAQEVPNEPTDSEDR